MQVFALVQKEQGLLAALLHGTGLFRFGLRLFLGLRFKPALFANLDKSCGQCP